MEDLHYRTVGELAALVRGGDASPRELVEASLERIERVDPAVNAFAGVDAELALAEAETIAARNGAPYAGVPFAVKANVAVEGRLLTMGSALLDGRRARHDAFLVRRLRAAGFVIVGITNMAEFGILPTTEPRATGATRNPWDLARTPGGSSGGSAAAVAAGMVPAAHGNDGGGSIRIPAACCGLVGLKPSRGRISRGPDSGDSFLASDGVLTRTVADTAALLDVLAGYEVGDATWAPRAPEPYAAVCRRDPGRLRIAVSSVNALGVPVIPEHLQTLQEAAGVLSGLGHEIVEATPPQPGPALLPTFLSVFGPNVAQGIAAAQRVAGRDAGPEDVEPLSRAVWETANGTSSQAYLTAVSSLQRLARDVIAFFAGFDLLMTPLLATIPLPVGELHGCGEHPLEDLDRSGAFAPFTALYNVTGQPAVSVPMGLGSDGLPLSVQLVGRPLGEDRLLQVAAQLEAETAPAGLPPEPIRGRHGLTGAP